MVCATGLAARSLTPRIKVAALPPVHGSEPVGVDLPRPPSSVERRLLAWADRPAGAAVLVVLALLEATIFPGPTEAMLIALTLVRPRRAWAFAAIATVASVVGGLIGYQLGAAFFESVTRPLLASYDLVAHADAVARVYRENAMLALITSGYTPIPYLLYTTMAGASSQPVLPFVVGSLIGRALKYVPIAALAYAFGPAVHRILRRHGWIAGAVVAAVILGLLLVGS